jgi:hypothetical protein
MATKAVGRYHHAADAEEEGEVGRNFHDELENCSAKVEVCCANGWICSTKI